MKVTSYQLKNLPDGTVFSAISNDSLKPEESLYKKMESLDDHDVMVEEMTLSQFSEVPGEIFRLGLKEDDEQEWEVWTIKEINIMIGWLMTSFQYIEAE